MTQRLPPSEANPQGLCMDKGYDYDEVRVIVEEFGFTAHIRARGKNPKLSSEKLLGAPLGG